MRTVQAYLAQPLVALAMLALVDLRRDPHAHRHAGHHRGLCAWRGRQSRGLLINTFFAVGVGAGLPSSPPQDRSRKLSRHAARRQRQIRHATINGRAYPIIDHTYDVVVVGAGGSGLARRGRRERGGPEDRLHHQSLSDALAHRRGARRHRRRARQYGPGRLALAHVRHRQGRRTGSATRTPSNISAATRRKPSTSSSIGACRSRAPRTARSISARSAA